MGLLGRGTTSVHSCQPLELNSVFDKTICVCECRVWLYAYVSTEHGGEALLPHFINHYHQLGLTYRRMLILVHHDPELAPKGSLTNIATICHGYNLECRFWEGTFDVDEQYRQHLKMLQDFVYDPYDWILYAEIHEFQDWQGPVKYVSISHRYKYDLVMSVLWYLQVCCRECKQKEGILYYWSICGSFWQGIQGGVYT